MNDTNIFKNWTVRSVTDLNASGLCPSIMGKQLEWYFVLIHIVYPNFNYYLIIVVIIYEFVGVFILPY